MSLTYSPDRRWCWNPEAQGGQGEWWRVVGGSWDNPSLLSPRAGDSMPMAPPASGLSGAFGDFIGCTFGDVAMGDAKDIIGRLSESVPGIVQAFTGKPPPQPGQPGYYPPGGTPLKPTGMLGGLGPYVPWILGAVGVIIVMKLVSSRRRRDSHAEEE